MGDPILATTMPVSAYISGPMTGHADHNYPAFMAAEERLKAAGVDHVLNPARNFDGRTDLPREEYLREDLRQLALANMVVVLPGWQTSTGARLEVEIAQHLGIPVVDVETLSVVDLPKQPPSILAEAMVVVQGARQQDYGHPLDNHERTAGMWKAYLKARFGVDVDLIPEDVCFLNDLQKITRSMNDLDHHRPIKRDNLVDIAGWTENVERVQLERERRKASEGAI